MGKMVALRKKLWSHAMHGGIDALLETGAGATGEMSAECLGGEERFEFSERIGFL